MFAGAVTLVNILTMLLLMFSNTAFFKLDFTPLLDETRLFIGEQTSPVSVVSDRFLSFGLDTSEIVRDIKKLRLDSSRLLKLASLLRPSHMRLGGTMSDRLIFMENFNGFPQTILPNPHIITESQLSDLESCDDENICSGKFLPYFTMNGKDWLKINEFCNKIGTRMLFDLNALLREGDDWNPLNAIHLMKFTKKNKLDIDWQLGDEPNSFLHVFNISITPQQLSRDFKKLRKLIDTYFPTSLLAGPDTTRPQPKRPSCVKYMKEFLAESSSTIDVIAWHQYYLNGRTATVEDFWNPDTLDLLQSQIDTMVQTIEPFRNDLPMWLSETSSAYGGGAPDLSNSFAGSPLWLDKLGVASLNGIQVVIRQSLIGGNYSLIDNNFNPSPDWWVSVLYKRLVGNKVIDCRLDSSKFQRFYCHCTNKNYVDYSIGSVTIYGINLLNSSIDTTLDVSSVDSGIELDEFVLTSSSTDRMSKFVNLNGKTLLLDRDDLTLTPKQLGSVRSIHMPKFSLGFGS